MDRHDTAQARLPRYARDVTRKPPFVLQTRDAEIIRTVAAHRVMSSEELRLLIEGSDQGLSRRLHALFHHGYLDRPRAQRAIVQNAPMTYALGQRGAEVVQRAPGEHALDWAQKNRDVRAPFIEHALMISRFRTAVELAVRAANGEVSLSAWHRDGEIRESMTIAPGDAPTRIPIAPDAYFVLQVHAEPSGKVHILLEADRGTMEVKRFATKVHGYHTWWQTGAAMKRIGAKNFIVATVARTPERASNLIEACRRIDGDLRMFLFTSEVSYWPPLPGRVFDAVWQSPQGSSHSLLE